MAGKSNSLEADVLNYIFFGTVPAWAGNSDFYISLHTSDPGDGGNQSTNEASYGGYARVAVPRTGVGWSISGSSITNAASVTFPACSGGTATITHFAIGTSLSGAGTLLYVGALTSSLAVSTGITPTFAASGAVVTED